MAVYLVERELEGITMEQLGAAQKAAIETGQRLTAQGTPVRYLRSTFVPGDARCLCLFEAQSPAAVRQLNETAKIPFRSIVEALDLAP